MTMVREYDTITIGGATFPLAGAVREQFELRDPLGSTRRRITFRFVLPLVPEPLTPAEAFREIAADVLLDAVDEIERRRMGER